MKELQLQWSDEPGRWKPFRELPDEANDALALGTAYAEDRALALRYPHHTHRAEFRIVKKTEKTCHHGTPLSMVCWSCQS